MTACYPPRRGVIGVFSLLLGICCFVQVQGQLTGTLNTYARVTGISGGTTLTVANISGASTLTTQFLTQGSRALVIQMRGATANTGVPTTNAAYGTLAAVGDINNAGNWEFVQVASVTGTTITLTSALTRTYTAPGGDVQIIHVPHYSTDQTVTGTITGPAWNPATGTGGVVAIVAQGRLTFTAAGSITANGLGFGGGAISADDLILTGGCAFNGIYAAAIGQDFGGKGSSVAAFPAAADQGARGRWISGGGGANQQNAGGAGGGNFTAGGDGGNGAEGAANCDLPAEGGRGLGGASLGAYYTTADLRLFLGGGGGGAHGDDGPPQEAGAGSAGGGIIIVRAFTLSVATAAGSRTISANGIAGASSADLGQGAAGGSDGAGGGGAGGAIILDVVNYDLPGSPGCADNLVVTANGGNGGNSTGTGTGVSRGGGGGGGAGIIALTNQTLGTSCITFSATVGTAGRSCGDVGATCNPVGNTPGNPIAIAGCPATNCAGGPVTLPGTLGTLPVTLVSLSAQRVGTNVALTWVTASELNNSHFTVERSRGGDAFQIVGTVPGAGTTQQAQTYRLLDPEVGSGELRYRLRQIDFDGTEHLFGPVRVADASGHSLRVLRNPIAAGEPVSVEVVGLAGLRVELVDLAGKPHASQLVSTSAATLVQLYSAELAPGLYLVRVVGTSLAERVVIR